MRHPEGRDLKDLTILAWVLCCFALCLLFVSERQGDAAERDFVYFYSVGRIADTHSPEQIYDFDVQRRTFQSVHRLKGDRVYGPSPYPPFIPLFFRLFSRLPFQTACYLWQGCTLALFCGGLVLLAGAVWPKQRLAQSLLFAAAISFAPFLIDTLPAGQLSAIGCFAFCLALYEQGRGHPFRSGLALSLGFYKPTLLLLVIPMLLIRRQWRTLSGMAAGGGALFALITVFMGMRVWTAYLAMILSLGGVQGMLEFHHYVDVVAFSTLLAHNHPFLKDFILLSAPAVVGGLVVRVWIRSTDNRMIWAATITWTLFLNLYVPIYDCVLLIPSVIWSAPTLLTRHRRYFTIAALLLFGVSWVSELIARTTGIQTLSIALALLGVLQLRASLISSTDKSDLDLNHTEVGVDTSRPLSAS